MDAPEIDYAPAPLLLQRRRVRAIAITALVASFVTFAGYRWGPPAAARMQMLYWQHEALARTSDPKAITCENDQARVSALANSGAYERITFPSGAAAVKPDHAWTKYAELAFPPGVATEATLFVGERRNGRGASRLVVVEGGLWASTQIERMDARLVELRARVIRPASWRSAPAEDVNDIAFLRLASPGPDTALEWLSGQPDPADPSHFFIPFRLGGRPGVVDGWLRDDGRCELETRAAP